MEYALSEIESRAVPNPRVKHLFTDTLSHQADYANQEMSLEDVLDVLKSILTSNFTSQTFKERTAQIKDLVTDKDLISCILIVHILSKTGKAKFKT